MSELDRLIPDGLGKMALADAGWSDEKAISCFLNEMACGQIKDLLAFDRWIEIPIEVLKGLLVAKCCGLFAPGE